MEKRVVFLYLSHSPTVKKSCKKWEKWIIVRFVSTLSSKKTRSGLLRVDIVITESALITGADPAYHVQYAVIGWTSVRSSGKSITNF